jgi:ferritin-like protein
MKDWHEPWEKLPEEARDVQRALVSLVEEIEAVNWYNQRAQLATDEGLKHILLHNRDEEIEHACMALEWLRRHVPKFDEELRTYLFQTGEITELEEKATGEGGETSAGSGGLGIGKPRRDE